MIHPFTTQRGERYLFVEVPETGTSYQIVYAPSAPEEQQLHYRTPWKGGAYKGQRVESEVLPPGSYSIISTSRDITEEQASMISEPVYDLEYGENTRGEVDRPLIGYKDYKSESESPSYYEYAIQSFRSLLQSLNINHCLILKINQDA